MPDDLETPARGYNTKDVEAQPAKAPARRRRWLWFLIGSLLISPVLVVSLWAWIALSWSFSSGERAGYVQKLSRRGWVCKTWEGELAMATVPGVMPEVFKFSVRNEQVAQSLSRSMGKRVSIAYEQHRGVPTSCFGDTEYFIVAVRAVGQ
jgi:hypothetical protein